MSISRISVVPFDVCLWNEFYITPDNLIDYGIFIVKIHSKITNVRACVKTPAAERELFRVHKKMFFTKCLMLMEKSLT